MPGAGLSLWRSGKAPPDRPAFQPYWGKPAVRNERGDRGNVGIIRSPVRASILPDLGGVGSPSIRRPPSGHQERRCSLTRQMPTSPSYFLPMMVRARARLICWRNHNKAAKAACIRIMVEQGRTRILFLSGLTPRCEQIFPHRCCFQPVRRIRQRCPPLCGAANGHLETQRSPPRGKAMRHTACGTLCPQQPAPVTAIAFQNKAVVYDLLFRTAADTILSADPKHLGARIGLIARAAYLGLGAYPPTVRPSPSATARRRLPAAR